MATVLKSRGGGATIECVVVHHLARQVLHDFVPGLPHVILILPSPHLVPGLQHRVERVIAGTVVVQE